MSILYFFGYLIDEAAEVPKKLANMSYFKIVVLPWMIFGAILCSIHSSQMITELNAPLPGQKLKFFKNISCSSDTDLENNLQEFYNRQLILLNSNFSNKILILKKQTQDNCFSVLSKLKIPAYQEGRNGAYFTPEYYEFPNLVNNQYIREHEYDKVFKILNPSTRWFPLVKNGQLKSEGKARIWEQTQKELAQCGRSIFVSLASEVEAYVERILKRVYPKANFYIMGEEMLDKRFNYFLFDQTISRSRMARIFKIFIESGIYGMLKNVSAVEKIAADVGFIKNTEDWEPFSAVELNGSVQTIFIIAAGCLMISMLVFAIEIREFVSLTCRPLYNSTYNKIEQFFKSIKCSNYKNRTVILYRGINVGCKNEI